MVNVMLEILEGFSLVWVLVSWHSKSAILQVTITVELQYMDVSSRHSNSNFAYS